MMFSILAVTFAIWSVWSDFSRSVVILLVEQWFNNDFYLHDNPSTPKTSYQKTPQSWDMRTAHRCWHLKINLWNPTDPQNLLFYSVVVHHPWMNKNSAFASFKLRIISPRIMGIILTTNKQTHKPLPSIWELTWIHPKYFVLLES